LSLPLNRLESQERGCLLISILKILKVIKNNIQPKVYNKNPITNLAA